MPADPRDGPRSHATAFQCTECGLLTTGRLPRGYREPGDGTWYYPRRHNVDGRLCTGSLMQAKWVIVTYGTRVFGGTATE